MSRRPFECEERRFPRAPSSARDARTFVAEQLQQWGADTSTVDDFRLVVSELTANAIEHGAQQDVAVTVRMDPQWWGIEVAGGSAGADGFCHPISWSMPSADAASGRGLRIVAALMDEVRVDDVDGAIVLRCRRRR